MSRFFVPKESIKGSSIYISGKEAHHIIDVMRLKFSDRVVIFDGTGKEYIGVVKEIGRRALFVEIIETRETAHKEKYSITLIQAIPKKEKMDYIIEKATELGASRIIPVTTGRTIPDWNEVKKVSMVERWKRVAAEAAKQCGRVDIPVIMPIMDFRKAITAAVGAGEKDDNTAAVHMIAVLSDKAIKLKDILRGKSPGKITIAIGPEGDFTPEEIRAAEEKGFEIVNLGPRVLKSDTAGLAAIAMMNYEYAD